MWNFYIIFGDGNNDIIIGLCADDETNGIFGVLFDIKNYKKRYVIDGYMMTMDVFLDII